jgi:hypothetical protein
MKTKMRKRPDLAQENTDGERVIEEPVPVLRVRKGREHVVQKVEKGQSEKQAKAIFIRPQDL